MAAVLSFLGVCAARPWLPVPALVRLSALSLLAVSLVCCLLCFLASRCLWLWLPGLPRAAPGVLLVLWLLLSLRPCLPWLLPLLVPLLLWWLSFSRRPRAAPLPLARCALLPRARGGPLRLPALWESETLLYLLGLLIR